jgi:hypothetical protein
LRQNWKSFMRAGTRRKRMSLSTGTLRSTSCACVRYASKSKANSVSTGGACSSSSFVNSVASAAGFHHALADGNSTHTRSFFDGDVSQLLPPLVLLLLSSFRGEPPSLQLSDEDVRYRPSGASSLQPWPILWSGRAGR